MHASLLRGGAPQFQRSEELRARESFVPVSFRDRAAPRRAAPRLASRYHYSMHYLCHSPSVPSTMWVYESKCIAYANGGRAPQSRGEFAVCHGE
jgi:hypothetical protein